MELDFNFLIRTFVGLIAIVNPIGAVPVFIALTSDRPDSDMSGIVKSTAITTAVTLLVAAFLGRYILAFFGISVASFQVGGGLLILLMGLSMLQASMSGAKHSSEEAEEAHSRPNIAVVPLAIPLLAGPGAITLVIVEAEKAFQRSLVTLGLLIFAILLIAATVALVLGAGPKIARKLGKTGVNVFTRVMGLIITAIAVEFMVTGLAKLLPGLGS